MKERVWSIGTMVMTGEQEKCPE